MYLFFENMPDKKIEVVGPLGIVVRIAIHMPYMRYLLFFEVPVHGDHGRHKPDNANWGKSIESFDHFNIV